MHSRFTKDNRPPFNKTVFQRTEQRDNVDVIQIHTQATQKDHIEGAVVAIGNAPTALFHLLEMLDAGWPKPAVILGFPVGFIGAAESKAELASNPRGCEFIALRGRRGGSAMASAAVNALAAGLPEDV